MIPSIRGASTRSTAPTATRARQARCPGPSSECARQTMLRTRRATPSTQRSRSPELLLNARDKLVGSESPPLLATAARVERGGRDRRCRSDVEMPRARPGPPGHLSRTPFESLQRRRWPPASRRRTAPRRSRPAVASASFRFGQAAGIRFYAPKELRPVPARPPRLPQPQRSAASRRPFRARGHATKRRAARYLYRRPPHLRSSIGPKPIERAADQSAGRRPGLRIAGCAHTGNALPSARRPAFTASSISRPLPSAS